MEYDNYGNITKKNDTEYIYGKYYPDDDFTQEPILLPWKDLLTYHNGVRIDYDEQGNPTSYLGSTLTWEKGRQLKRFVKSDETVINYTYNANGIRTSKTVNGIEHKYTLDGTKILREEWIDKCCTPHSIVPLYDNEDSVCGIIYNDVPYYFIKNLQGDIIAIVDKDAKTVAHYSYDAWGKIVSITDEEYSDISYIDSHIANINPFRYRSYYYDEEIGLYYLQSRYYDADVGRFINSDDPLIPSITTERNMFSYCKNDIVNSADGNGYLTWPGQIHNYVQMILVSYILLTYGCLAYMNYYVKLGFLKRGFADLYVKVWNEVWEVKPDKSKYRYSGPKQLQKYIDRIPGSIAGRNLGKFVFYLWLDGLYKVKIISNTSDGMIYYDYEMCWRETTFIALSIVSTALMLSGVGAGVGVATAKLARILLLAGG